MKRSVIICTPVPEGGGASWEGRVGSVGGTFVPSWAQPGSAITTAVAAAKRTARNFMVNPLQPL